MFTWKGARRTCIDWLYSTDDKEEAEFLRKNKMFEELAECGNKDSKKK